MARFHKGNITLTIKQQYEVYFHNVVTVLDSIEAQERSLKNSRTTLIRGFFLNENFMYAFQNGSNIKITELEKILTKNLNEMSEIETAIWFTASGTIAYDMQKAAEQLARLQAIEVAAGKARNALVRVKPQAKGVLVVQDIEDAIKSLSALDRNL